MKNLTIKLSLLLLLASSPSAFAEVLEAPSSKRANIETIVVMATPEIAGFEIYSERHIKQAMNKIMSIVATRVDNNEKANNSSDISSPI